MTACGPMNDANSGRLWRPGMVVALTVFVFLGFHYLSGIRKLMAQSTEMTSRFNQAAVDDYMGYLIGQNLQVLLAYVLLGIAGWLVIVPAVVLIQRRWPWFSGWRLLLPAAVLLGLLHSFFMLRMVYDRPYFMAEGAAESWFSVVLDMPPETWRPAIHGFLFELFPWLIMAAALIWWCLRAGPRWGWVAIGMLPVAGVAGFVIEQSSAGDRNKATDNHPQRPNILIIGSDSLRGDKLGYAGYRPGRSDGPAAAGVSPNIDRWAEQAAIFEQCRTPLASTLESGISVMSSMYPHSYGIRQMFPSRGEIEAMEKRITPLASVLAEQGYKTEAIGDWCAGYYEVTPLGFEKVDVSSFDNFRIYMSQAVFMSHFMVPLYFDHDLGYRLFPQIRSFASFVTPDVVTDRVKTRLRQHATDDRPFFIHAFYSCNHLPYRAREPFGQMFSDPDYSGPHATSVDFDINEFISGTDLEDKWAAMPKQDVEQIRALYDGCTRLFDHHFGRIMQTLEETGQAENTIVVLTADHGDDLYEPGVTLGHGLSFLGGDASYHVPMAIRGPGIEPGRFAEQTRTIDLAPTLTGLLEMPANPRWEGVDLSPWIDDPSRATDLPYYGETQFPFIYFKVDGIERPPLKPMDQMCFVDASFNHQFVMHEAFRQPVVEAKQHCLRTRDWKLVATPTADGRRDFKLFHTRSDPHSLIDLAVQRPEVLEPMRQALTAWFDDQDELMIGEIFPAGEPAMDAAIDPLSE